MPTTSRCTAVLLASKENGTSVPLRIFVEVLRAGKTVGGPDEILGRQSIQLASGESVVRRRKGRYQVLSTGETLYCDDPAAP